MKGRVWLFLMGVLVIASMLLAACGPQATPTAPPAEKPTEKPAPTAAPTVPPKPAQKVTIRLTTWAGVQESAELQQVIDKINAQVTHFQIVHEPAPDEYYTKVQTTLAGGTAADLIWLSQEWIAGLASQGALLD
ncbi:MAG: sugar ABC transporter substrate-binding protein, partial [Anaerolineae bacterium]|nr:sugar ABC transporter substrate-binding protein [Anaerolineae bacterium]